MTPTRPTSGDIPLPAEPLGGVVFDMDGLMFNTEGIYQEVGRRVLARFGKDFPEALIDQIMGLKTEQALGVMIQWHRLDVSLDEFAELSYRCFQSLLPQRLEPMPGLLPLLSDLERIGVPKAIATSSQRRTADDVLARFNLHARFAAILTSEDVEQGKPAPEIYQRSRAGLPTCGNARARR